MNVQAQSAGIKPVVILSSNGETVQGSFEFLANPVYAFVTSTSYTGNLGGLAGADAQCQARATAASLPLPTTYLAWIDNGTDFTRISSLATGTDFTLVNGTVFATSYSVLVNNPTHTPLFALDEFGTTVANGALVWTGGGSNPGWLQLQQLEL